MKVVLLKDIPKLGKKGDIIEVSGGYAKNSLLPKKEAMFADESTIRKWKEKKEKESREFEKKKEYMYTFAAKLKQEVFQFPLSVGKNGEVFNSLHEDIIREEIMRVAAREKMPLEKNEIHLHTKPIKQLGEIEIPVEIGKGEYALRLTIRIQISPQTNSAE